MEAENGEYHIGISLLTAGLEIFLTPLHENAVNILSCQESRCQHFCHSQKVQGVNKDVSCKYLINWLISLPPLIPPIPGPLIKLLEHFYPSCLWSFRADENPVCLKHSQLINAVAIFILIYSWSSLAVADDMTTIDGHAKQHSLLLLVLQPSFSGCF